jgi:sec-independent protein translocase protein TatC
MALDQVDVDQLPLDGSGEKDMSFFDHINELRGHILRSVAAVLVAAVVMFVNKDFIFKTVLFGPRRADFPTYKAVCWLADALQMPALCFQPALFNIETRDLGEVFFQHMSVAFFMGVVIAFPYIFWEIWRFVSPGLEIKERRGTRGVVLVCSFLFSIGVLFGYYVIAPFAISFLGSYTIEGVSVTPTLSSYVSNMVMFTMPIGIVFQLPAASYLLAKIGLLTAKMMRGLRRHMIVIILIVAGVITPSPDVVSQLLVGIPLYGLFEISIIVAHRVEKRREKEDKD